MYVKSELPCAVSALTSRTGSHVWSSYRGAWRGDVQHANATQDRQAQTKINEQPKIHPRRVVANLLWKLRHQQEIEGISREHSNQRLHEIPGHDVFLLAPPHRIRHQNLDAGARLLPLLSDASPRH